MIFYESIFLKGVLCLQKKKLHKVMVIEIFQTSMKTMPLSQGKLFYYSKHDQIGSFDLYFMVQLIQ